MNRQRIIVNADDFGKSPEVNHGIAVCFERRLIDRTTLMVNMPYAAEAIELAVKQGFIDQVGLHLNLTEGKPLTEDIMHLGCSENGDCMTKGLIPWLRHRVSLNGFERNALKKEIEAQIRLFRDYGLRSVHIDSHHHVHNEMHILGLAISAAKNHGFKSMRMLRNLMTGNNFSDAVKLAYKHIQNRRIAMNFIHTDYFGSLNDYIAYGSVKRGSIEIMVHPTYSDNGLADTVESGNLEIQLKNIDRWN